MAEALKSCPLCSGPVTMHISEGSTWVACERCQLDAHLAEPDEPITCTNRWNHRPTEDRLRAEIERLREALGKIASAAYDGASGSERLDGSRRTPHWQERDCMDRIRCLINQALDNGEST